MQNTVNTMKQASHYLLLCILAVFVLSSCHDDLDESTGQTSQVLNPPSVHFLTIHDVLGYIYDENNEPIEGVQVQIGEATTTTNAAGLFIFDEAKLDRNGSYVKAVKDGYVLGSDMLYPSSDNDEVYSYINMMALESDKDFDASTGGTIDVTGGGTVTFAPGSIVDASGSNYTGTVSVTAKRLAADDRNIADLMPGALVAEDKDGKTRVLGTLGMVAVELRGENGQELNLADGMTAAIEFPIAAFQQAEAPEQIELWYFDEERGIWKEEGFATKDGNSYKGEVAHFSFWNCDAPFPLIHVCGQINFADGTPGANLSVQVQTNAYYPTAWGYTDSQGSFCGKMPKNETLVITVYYSGCEQQGYTFTVGPFTEDTQLDEVTLPEIENSDYITGTVECNGTLVSNASVILSLGYSTQVFSAAEDGSFAIPVLAFGCDPQSQGTIYAIDNNTNQVSQTQNIDINTDAAIQINVCPSEGCTLAAVINIDEGDVCDITTTAFEAQATGGSGSYSYLWNDGSTLDVLHITEDSIQFSFCVTITDVNDPDCFDVACTQVEYNPFNMFISAINAGCDGGLGTLNVEHTGGIAPYTTETFDASGNSVNISTTNNEGLTVSDLAVGSYSVVSTDAQGCSLTLTIDIEEEDAFPEPGIWQECNQVIVNFWNSGQEITINYEGEEYVGSISFETSGTYCMVVSNGQGCSEDICVTVEVQDLTPPVIDYSCNFPDYSLTFNGAYYVNISPTNGSSIGLSDVVDFNYSVLQYGYQFTASMYVQQECEFEEMVTLPNFSGLSVIANQPTCVDCTDGSITINVDNTEACLSCMIGDSKVYRNNDGTLGEDVTASNEAGTLGSGSYFVVVLDATTGCIVAHEAVTLE